MTQTIENPATGDRVVFLETARETNGARLKIEYVVTRRETKPHIPLHIHLVSAEKFIVTQGTLGVVLGSAQMKQILKIGEEVMIRPRTPHTFWNAGADELHFITEITPAGNFQTYWETLFGLARDGKVNQAGLPNFWQLMVLAEIADSYAAGAPPTLAKGIIAVGAAIGKALGYRAEYPQYAVQA